MSYFLSLTFLPKKGYLGKNLYTELPYRSIFSSNMKKKKPSQHKIVLAVLFIVIGIAIGLSLKPKQVKEINDIIKLEGEKQSSMNILAINNNNEGVFSRLTAKVHAGNGLVLLNINDILADYNSQYSARVATKVAADYTNISLNNIDVIYSIDANATAIEGSSAGSAMAVTAIAALQNKQINPKVVITGSINEDGTLGSVGAIRQKAEAAKEAGATVMLVPAGSLNKGNNHKEERSCTYYNELKYCELKYVSQQVDYSKELGIDIIEVANVGEALGYFYEGIN